MSNEVDELLHLFAPFPASVIPLLQEIQAHYGYISEANLTRVATYAHTPESTVYSVATFYSQFRLTRPGRYSIRICQGTACHVLGANSICEHLEEQLGVKMDETTGDGLFTLESVRCLGCCSLAPAMMIGDKIYGRLTRGKVDTIIGAYRNREEE
ncbi:NADH-quinone oxidoreductase subunit NuoE [Candidatus Bipolaricaulota bacterium]|nr:NADH-quinone oxidoreductase subunit NuoE [Candidatus Bipolaricaulota bacterium]